MLDSIRWLVNTNRTIHFHRTSTDTAVTVISYIKIGDFPVINAKSIASLFDQWNAALKTADPDQVVACYAPDAILLPTVSAQVRHNHAEIRDYFVHFCAKAPEGRIDESNIRTFDDIAINSGCYTFEITDNGQRVDVAARFTFVYRKIESEWLIIEHHSSVLPSS